jgi:NAD(P)-dependent dehydrogenase (short-subunit alcohol dehydrogenase family)
VREAAAKVLTWKDVPTMDILVNNAAAMNLPERMLSEDGIETQFATNHVGNLPFTCLIIPKLFKVAETSPRGVTRVINVSSLSSVVAGVSWSDINFNKINKTLSEAEQPPYSTHTLG